jgi:hypothetical protein
MHQPSYFPWLGLLHKIAASDVFMVMDDVQLTDSAYQHRNLFLTADGKVKFLTIPFNRKNYLQRPFRELEIQSETWRIDHLNFLRNCYRRHPFYSEVMPLIEDFLSRPYGRLVDAVMESMRLSLNHFGIRTKVIFQSDMNYDQTLKKGDLVLALVKAAEADCYLSGTGARAYLDEAKFMIGARLSYDTFTHPVYEQRNAATFVPGLSGLDYLFNLGLASGKAEFARVDSAP